MYVVIFNFEKLMIRYFTDEVCFLKFFFIKVLKVLDVKSPVLHAGPVQVVSNL